MRNYSRGHLQGGGGGPEYPVVIGVLMAGKKEQACLLQAMKLIDQPGSQFSDQSRNLSAKNQPYFVEKSIADLCNLNPKHLPDPVIPFHQFGLSLDRDSEPDPPIGDD